METQQDHVSQLQKQLQKLWSALQKMLKSQIGKERCIDFPLVGKFQNRSGVISYMPALDFLASGHFKFLENENNISPFSKSAIGFQTAALISLTAICAVIEIDRESAASYLKQIIVEFISQARQRKPCALKLGVGWLFANVEGELTFTTESSKLKIAEADLVDQEDLLSQNSRFGIKKDSVSTVHESVKTPYTNIGNKVSVYHGRNSLLQNWYTPVKTHQPREDNYSMFSKAEQQSTFTEKKQSIKSNYQENLVEVLKDNQFVTAQTFEEFLARQKKGKKHFFLKNMGKQNEITKKLHDSYLEVAARKREAIARQRFQNILEENNNNIRVSQEMEDLQEIETGLKQAKITKMRQNVYQGIQERRVSDNIQAEHRQLPGFTQFPYTHGDAVEEMRKVLNVKRRQEEIHSGREIRSESAQPAQQQPKGMHFDDSQKEILIQKFLDTTPFFDRNASRINRDQRRHTVEHNSSALDKARERFQKDILYKNLSKLEGERIIMERQQQTYLKNIKKNEQDLEKKLQVQKILLHQQELNQMKQEMQDQEKRELCRTNFGPEEPADNQIKILQAKKQSQSMLKSHFQKQMSEKTRNHQRQRLTELRVDHKNNQIAQKLDERERMSLALQQKQQRVNLIQNWVRQTQDRKKIKL